MKIFNRNLIKRTLSQPEALKTVNQSMIEKAGQSLSKFADHLCKVFNFFGDKGKAQTTTCAQALKELDRKGHISLESTLDYKPQDVKRPHNPKCLDEAVPQPGNIPEDVEQIKDLKILRVQNDQDLKTWNTVMAKEHRLGANMHPGRSIKFLEVSEHGLIAAVSFCSASLHIKARDEWIGWTNEERRLGLDDVVVQMNRFLVREGAQTCHNLPLKIISLLFDALRKEWKAVYDREIYLVETFVDPRESDGTIYQNSNWIEVVKTSGRGYNDRTGKADVVSKLLFIYPLVPDFRKLLELKEPEDMSLPEWKRKGPLAPYEGLKGESWAAQEFGSCKLGHKDRNARLIYSAKIIAKCIKASINLVMGADMAGRKGWYRFIESPHEAINAENILSGHHECTCRRMLCFNEVLHIQDGTDINLSGKTGTEGLGQISSNGSGSVTLGIKAHSTISAGIEWNDDGTLEYSFLGIFKVSFWTRPRSESRKGKKTAKVPVEQRESYHWVEHAESVNAVGEHTPNTIHITVCDRGSDSAYFLSKVIDMEHCEAIVRAKSDRRVLGEKDSLFTLMSKMPPGRTITVNVPRKSTRLNGAGDIISKGRPARQAKLEILFRPVKFAPSPDLPGSKPIEVVCVTAVEIDPPKGEDRIIWHLLTTLPVKTHEDAVKIVMRYGVRWVIEELHGMLKEDGCDVESFAYKTAERMERAIAVYMVVAWWLMHSLNLARLKPDLPPETMFDEVEQEILRAEVEETQKRKERKLETLGDFVGVVAIMGGWRGGKDWGHPSDPRAGYEVFWKGYMKLQERCRYERYRRRRAALAEKGHESATFAA